MPRRMCRDSGHGPPDTVHPIGTLVKLPFRREGSRAWGPGIQDMKGGNYLSLEAIRQLQRAGVRTKLPVTVLFTSDEEVGSPSTRDLIEAEAARAQIRPGAGTGASGWRGGDGPLCDRALQPGGHGPAEPCGGSIWGRGGSAIREMARKLIEIEDMTTETARSVWACPWRPVGQLRRHHLHWRGAVDGEAAGGPRSRGRGDAGAAGVVQ